MVKELASKIVNIRSENEILADSVVITNEFLQQELTLILPSDLVEKFMSLLLGTSEYEVIQENIDISKKIDPQIFVGESLVSASYDELRKKQRLKCKGILSDAKKSELKDLNPSSTLLAELLDDVQKNTENDLASQLEKILGSLTDMIEFEAIQTDIPISKKLEPEMFNEPALRVSYDENSETQRLSFRGILFDAKKVEIENTIGSSSVLSNLLNNVQKQGIEFANEIIKSSISIIVGEMSFEVIQENVDESKKLDSRKFALYPMITVNYDDISKTQQFSFRGILHNTTRLEIENTIGSSGVLSNLLDNVQKQMAIFIKSLKQGYLAKSDFNPIFITLDDLPETLEEGKIRLVKSIVPIVQKRKIRQLIVEYLSSAMKTDPSLTEALLTDTKLITDPILTDQMLLSAFAGANEEGISASFFENQECAGNPITTTNITTINTAATEIVIPPKTKSVCFEGYMEVPKAGPYRFYVSFDKKDTEIVPQSDHTKVELLFDHLANPLLNVIAPDGDIDFSDFADLKPGEVYHLKLNIKNLEHWNVKLEVQSEDFPKGNVSQLILYPKTVVESIRKANILLRKSFLLIQILGLNEREIRYILTHSEDFDNINLNNLPTIDAQLELKNISDEYQKAQPSLTKEQAMAKAKSDNLKLAREVDEIPILFGQLIRISNYSQLKEELAGGTDAIIDIFENAHEIQSNSTGNEILEDLCKRFAELTRRDALTVQETANELEFKTTSNTVKGLKLVSVPDFKQEKGLKRLWDALKAVEKFNVSVESIVGWTKIVDQSATLQDRSNIAQDVKNTIKAKFEAENWLRIAQSVFDKLRKRQRNALVAHIMHKHDFTRIEQLFEYFLIDPGMEPVVQTSRIRLAISSIQLFIQRCLLNMEKGVQPSAINSKHWQWIKRYRVWEANRKIFLFPENWLEPEFRDDKTHLFQEMESTLLQGDVSNNLVEDAFFNYLKKLEELARLDIVAMYCEESTSELASNTLHVIGRTYNTPHKYFYRRYSHNMWTPWEPVPVEIEGNHIIPVVWRERLHLFWITFLEKPDLGSARTTPPKLNNIDATSNLGSMKTAMQETVAKKQVDVQLHWSEYFQGNWSTKESDGFGTISKPVPSTFDPQKVFIYVSKVYGDNGEEKAVKINITGKINSAFQIASKNSRPEEKVKDSALPNHYNTNNCEIQANRYKSSEKLEVTFDETITIEYKILELNIIVYNVYGQGIVCKLHLRIDKQDKVINVLYKDLKNNESIQSDEFEITNINQIGDLFNFNLLFDDRELVITGLPSNTLENGGTWNKKVEVRKFTKINKEVLRKTNSFTLLPCANVISVGTSDIAALVSPFFYQDNLNTFFVEPNLTEETIDKYEDYGPFVKIPDYHSNIINEIPLNPTVHEYKFPVGIDPSDPIWNDPTDRYSKFEGVVKTDWLVNPLIVVEYNGRLIGSQGKMDLDIETIIKTGNTAVQGQLIDAKIGSISGSESIKMMGVDQIEASNIGLREGAINVVGSSGIRQIAENIKLTSINLRSGVR